MPEPITIGHAMIALALVSALAAIAFVAAAARYRGEGHGRGTPGYARARLARRKALYAAAFAVILFVAGALTPLSQMALA